MAQIIRPVHGKLRVTLPFRPGGANYDLLKTICGDQSRPQWNRELRCFEVARGHLVKLIDQLPNEVAGPVEVVLYGARQTKCVSACWDANPDTRWECVCSCAGANHGTRRPLTMQVSTDLSVDTEYTYMSYLVGPRS
jgi:hypothetical protein